MPAVDARGGWGVRDAMAADAAAVQAVASAAWRDTYLGLLRPETIDAFIARAYSIESLERRIGSDEFLLVIAGDDRLVAFADAIVRDDRIVLAAIYALPALRGQGAGSRLLDVLRSRHPGLPVAADVLAGNRKGEIFYERRGFVPRETLQDVLFGEPVVERRWWSMPPPTSVAGRRQLDTQPGEA